MSAKRKRDEGPVKETKQEEKRLRLVVREKLTPLLAYDVLNEIDDFLAEWTEIVFVLDKSGSMQSVMADTIQSVNDYITDQKQTEGKVLFSLLQFNDRVTTMVGKESIHDVPPLTDVNYTPGGGTALHDAIGCAITKCRSSEATNKILVIFTDGAENGSKMYTKKAVQGLITEIRAENWQVIYMRANADEFLVGNEARDLGINFAVPVTNHVGNRGVSMPNIPVLMRQVSAYTRLTTTDPNAAARLQRTLSCQIPARQPQQNQLPPLAPLGPFSPLPTLHRQTGGLSGPLGPLDTIDDSDDEMPPVNPQFPQFMAPPRLSRAKS